MKIRDCGKKFAVVTSRYHKNGGFEETMPEDTMWLCERNPDVAAFLKEAALRRVDIVLVDEDGTPFPDISMADLKGFAREQAASPDPIQIIVLASEDRQKGDADLAELAELGVRDVLDPDDPRHIAVALADMLEHPAGPDYPGYREDAPKGGFFKRIFGPGRKKGRGEASGIAASLGKNDGGEPAPISTEPSEAAVARKMVAEQLERESAPETPSKAADGKAQPAAADPISAAIAAGPGEIPAAAGDLRQRVPASRPHEGAGPADPISAAIAAGPGKIPAPPARSERARPLTPAEIDEIKAAHRNPAPAFPASQAEKPENAPEPPRSSAADPISAAIAAGPRELPDVDIPALRADGPETPLPPREGGDGGEREAIAPAVAYVNRSTLEIAGPYPLPGDPGAVPATVARLRAKHPRPKWWEVGERKKDGGSLGFCDDADSVLRQAEKRRRSFAKKLRLAEEVRAASDDEAAPERDRPANPRPDGNAAADIDLAKAQLAEEFDRKAREMAEMYERKAREMAEMYERKLAAAMRGGRPQRSFAVCSLTPEAPTASASVEAAMWVRERLPELQAAVVEHDGAKLESLAPYGAVAPGNAALYPDVVVHDLGCDLAAARGMALDGAVVLLVISPEPWLRDLQARAWAASAETHALLEDGGLVPVVAGAGNAAAAIAEAVLGVRPASVALTDPSLFCRTSPKPGRAIGHALEEQAALVAREAAEQRRTLVRPGEPSSGASEAREAENVIDELFRSLGEPDDPAFEAREAPGKDGSAQQDPPAGRTRGGEEEAAPAPSGGPDSQV